MLKAPFTNRLSDHFDETITDTTNAATDTKTGADSSTDTRGPTRLFFVGMALYMILLVFVGFWPSYFELPFSGQPLSEEIAPRLSEGALLAPTWLIHLHVAVFLGWIVLFLAQAILVNRDRIRKHVSLGWRGFLYGIGAIVVGLSLTLQGYWGLVRLGKTTWAEFPVSIWWLPGWFDMIQFSLLVGLGYVYRQRPGMHKRYMLFATTIFLHPAFGRMDYLLGDWNHQLMVLLLAGPVWAYDLYTAGRLHSASLIGTAVLGVDVFVLYPLIFG